MRFSFAHELGHLFLHKDLYRNFDVASPEDWKNFILNVPETEYSKCEWQANEFAGRLLVPSLKLQIEIEKMMVFLKKNHLIEYLKEEPDGVLSGISPSLSKPFGVSTGVITRRVKSEGLWPPKS